MGRARLLETVSPGVLAACAVAGLAVAAYLTAVHYQAVPLACARSSVVNCAEVTQSSYSLIPGTSLPITVLGFGWFLVSLALVMPALRSASTGPPEPAWTRPAHFGWAVIGLLYVLYLVYAELVVIHRLCEWCTAVHLLVFATFLLTLRRWQTAQPRA